MMIEKKETFNTVTKLYDQIRPDYPLTVLQQIERFASLNSSSSMVEIGPGTGQASEYFIRSGHDFLGVELGEDLTAFANNKYNSASNARFICSSFEDWECQENSFDLFLAAQCFYWIDTESGVRKVAQLLKTKGSIALMCNLDESQNTEFWERGSSIHNEYFSPEAGPGRGLAAWRIECAEALSKSELFRDCRTIEHEWQKEYTADEWIKMRGTFFMLLFKGK